MSLTFVNHVPDDTINIVYVYLDTSCPYNFRKEGFYVIGPGASINTWNGDVSSLNRYWYFWAQSVNGLYWAGGDGPIEISFPHEFDQCVYDNANMTMTVGLQEIDVNGYSQFTVNLWGPGGPPKGS
jgi:hypothetical protein